MSIVRSRLSQQESRSAALEAARRLLLEQGPQAVTLKAVAAEIGRTHANLLHHFGSAAGLQAELARSIGAQSMRNRSSRSARLSTFSPPESSVSTELTRSFFRFFSSRIFSSIVPAATRR